ncbi:TPA: GNAT family N-acetyltransferase [Vibrio alginolyticus]|uniref:GNAT family N-acetyltransferase n=1 Tax=Vibrio alginolyticus TaxID=663 RepID=UPI001BD65D16|nr:GNAT family N-acetyltransferase [Vibrio alginolyticus]MBS9854917.1 GNAT family N-acetyltransferase [Vibrio alginolyticus]MCR9571010.1 GNAT family N-acetyltransferase [Vibrio alginolyticus]MCS0084776.1 GNAT family N-acetyltransferase [Vibrio alginolyticus]
MYIYYTNSLENVDWNQVSDLFEIVGWGKRNPKQVEQAFKASSFVRFAYLDGELIGVGRTVDDGLYYGWIVDLAILPQCQGKGVGKHILSELEVDLRPYITTMLTAAPGKSGFYEKLGWRKQRSAYIWPRSKGQIKEFT